MNSPTSVSPGRLPVPTSVVVMLVVLVLVAMIGSACTIAEAEPTQPVAASSEYGIVADPPLPLTAPVAPLAGINTLADHDGSVVVRLSDGVVEFVEATGTELVNVQVDPSAELRAVSADGSRVAIFTTSTKTADGISRITVVDRSNHPPAISVHALSGTVEPEAFSTDGRRLFVIDHQVSDVPGAYRVRPLDLETGKLEDILSPTKTPFDDDMNGVGRRQIWAPDANRLYTLYIRQTHHHHPPGTALVDTDHGHGESGTDGFIHVLDLAEEWAFCLDLPETFGGGDLETTALAVSPDGKEVVVADLSAGAVAFASTEDLIVTRTAALPEIELLEDTELHLGLLGPSPPGLEPQSDSVLLLAAGTTGRWLTETTGSSRLEPTNSGPLSFDEPVRGITSGTDAVLIWPNNLGNGPTEFGGPR